MRLDRPTLRNACLIPIAAKGYVAVDDLAIAMDRYNQTLLEVCRQQSLECYDLAADVPKDSSHFYDDVHFNEGGSRTVASSLADYLAARPPFRP